MKTVLAVPTINANDEVVVVVRWHVADGGRIEAGAPLVDVETTKAVVTIEAEQAGWVRHRGREGEEIAVGAELAWYFSEETELEAVGVAVSSVAAPAVKSAAAAPATARPEPATSTESAAPLDFSLTRLSPGAEKLAASLGLDAAALAQARLGLVTSAELQARLTPKSAAASPTAAPDDGLRRERVAAAKRAEIQALRDGAGEHLKSSLTLYFDSAGVRAGAAAANGGVLPVLLAELTPLLVTQPRFTAFYDDGHTAFHGAVHLGVAVDLGQGLRVVTLRDAATLDAAAIGRRLAELTLDYMENKLAPADVQGATFTVTDLSGFDVLQFEPLINGRQSAILGLGGDSTLPGHPMSLTLAFDHRVLTGREVGAFLQALRDRILAHAIGAVASAEGSEAPASAPACCDRCLIDLAGYYEKFGGVGVMHHYARPDGTTGLICHSCLASF